MVIIVILAQVLWIELELVNRLLLNRFSFTLAKPDKSFHLSVIVTQLLKHLSLDACISLLNTFTLGRRVRHREIVHAFHLCAQDASVCQLGVDDIRNELFVGHLQNWFALWLGLSKVVDVLNPG
jgi:hypothetical protein